jgi:uncharacterized protein (TIGR03435 family)
MNFKLFLLLLALVASASPQTGFYGNVTNHVKAGDTAPEIAFTSVLSSPTSAPLSQLNFSGDLTVLVFSPDTSNNLELVTQWNALVDQFANKAVTFVWVTGEEESNLLPWLSQHAMRGWVVYDQDGGLGAAYGLELPGSVLVGRDHRILGFHDALLPEAEMLIAALEGRTTTTPPTKASLKAFAESRQVLLKSVPSMLPHMGANRPDFRPSNVLHVALSQREGTSNSKGPDFWSLQGYELADVIAELFGVNPNRIELPRSLNNHKRYDLALVWPKEASEEDLRDYFRQAFEKHFHITANWENRLVDVYVVSASEKEKITPAEPSDRDPISSSFGSIMVETVAPGTATQVPKSVSIAAIKGVRMSGTVDDFCGFLEKQLDHPVVNETGLQGTLNFDVTSSVGVDKDFLTRVRDQLGLVINTEQRPLEVLAVHVR